MIKKTYVFCLIVAFSAISASAEMYDDDKLTSSGVSMKDGMYYCDALGSYIRPYTRNSDVDECGYATEAQKICSSSPNTRWISGRCFCPERNQYLDSNPRGRYNIDRKKLDAPDAHSSLQSLGVSVNSCPEFIPRKNPYGRSVKLVPNENSFIVDKINPIHQWDNRDDFPGEQGNPNFPALLASKLGISIGFGYDENGLPVIPKFDTLITQLKKIKSDATFFEVNGELSGREYLENFMNNRLPIARISDTGDATYFLHDINFHAMALILIPQKIRELAQKETNYLLDFIDYFSTQYPEEWSKPQFKLMMQKLIEDQVSQIDAGTGNLVQSLYMLLKNETSFSNFLSALSLMNRHEKAQLHFRLMAITGGSNGFAEERSVKECLKNKKYLVHRAFEEENKTDQSIFEDALFAYIRSKESVPEFVNQIQVDHYKDIYWGKPSQHGSAVDLLIERLHQLRRNQ
jgi:Fe-S cluster assembly iron-binding protein IscA